MMIEAPTDPANGGSLPPVPLILHLLLSLVMAETPRQFMRKILLNVIPIIIIAAPESLLMMFPETKRAKLSLAFGPSFIKPEEASRMGPTMDRIRSWYRTREIQQVSPLPLPADSIIRTLRCAARP